MSTSSIITLHNISSHEHGFTTASFYRHQDSGNFALMANMFYHMFDAEVKGGAIEALIVSAPRDVTLSSMTQYEQTDCFSDYHYHLDMETLELTVVRSKNVIIKTDVATFINEHSKECKAIKATDNESLVWNAEPKQKIYTRDTLFYKLSEYVAVLKTLRHLNGSKNPNLAIYCDRLDRTDSFLSEMHLTEEQQKLRSIVQGITLKYQTMLHA